MSSYSLSRLTNEALLHDLTTLVAQDRSTTASLLAHLAEVDTRRLYVPAGYPSMHAWCLGVLKLSEDSTAKRIQAARAARRFPAIFPMVADGRLTLTAVVLLAPHLTPDNVDDLLAAAAHQPRAGVERLVAERFPKPDLPTRMWSFEPAGASGQLVPERVQGDVNQHAARHVHAHTRLTPLSVDRVALQGTIRQATHEKLSYAQSLLGAEVPSGDLDPLLDRALDALIVQLEKKRFAATSRPRPSGKCHKDGSRHVPADVKRLVWQRDGGQCTFVSDKGHRCEARRSLEFDHIAPFARGGQSTPSNLRLRCRAHNQYEAERTYGSDLMRHKREERKRHAAEARAREAARAQERERQAALQARRDELARWLRQLGYSLAESKRAAMVCDDMPDASPEQLLRAALRSLLPPRMLPVKPFARGAA